jgi:pilus assembly protein CpaC
MHRLRIPAAAAALLLACSANAASAAAATPRGDGLQCNGEPGTPVPLLIHPGKSLLYRLPEPVASRSVGNPEVVQAMLVAPHTLYLLGVEVGATNLMVQGRSGACTMLDVTVAMDAGGLQAALALHLPDEKNIRVSAAADSLVLSGTVEDGVAQARALELAQAYVRRPLRAMRGARGEDEQRGAAIPQPPGSAAALPAQTRIVNLLNISSPQQVMLEVKIAEVSRTLLDTLEGAIGLRRGFGSWTATVAADFLSGMAGGGISLKKSNGNRLALEADRQNGLVRVLAEPTLVAISGQEGSFLAGGKILVPVQQENNKVTLEEKEFGVGLRFTPTVLSGGRISLHVAPEVSELSRDGVGINAQGINARAILPLITTRRAMTTVQLHDGQSFAIGGLIRNTQVSNIHGLPLLGEVPVLGALFRSTDFQQDRSELLFVITARLVKPLPVAPALPTDAVQTPGRAELFLGGRLESATPPAAAADAPRPSGYRLK